MSVVIPIASGHAIADLLRRGFHSVVFQPIRCLGSDDIYGFEALMRGPVGTPLADPGRIFREGILERTLLHRLDIACFSSAVRLGRLVGDGQMLFINMHGETLLRSAKASDDFSQLLDVLGLAPSRLVIEISEMTDRLHVRSIARSLRPLRDAGVRIALDDIGARYAWLHHMLWLEPDFLKLDRSFVRGAVRSSRRCDLIAGVVAFARSGGSEVIAEGIETPQERDAIHGAGVRLGQGFLLGIPKSAQEWFPLESIGEERTRVAALCE